MVNKAAKHAMMSPRSAVSSDSAPVCMCLEDLRQRHIRMVSIASDLLAEQILQKFGVKVKTQPSADNEESKDPNASFAGLVSQSSNPMDFLDMGQSINNIDPNMSPIEMQVQQLVLAKRFEFYQNIKLEYKTSKEKVISEQKRSSSQLLIDMYRKRILKKPYRDSVELMRDWQSL
jgi:hypothetical protein